MNTLIKTVEVLGIIAFALTGISAARKKGMDIVGVYSVAMITAFGGGSLRDLILNRHPLFWIEHYEYAVLLLVMCLLASGVVAGQFKNSKMIMVVLVLDALGLGFFSASGASVADQTGMRRICLVPARCDHRGLRRRDARYHLQRGPLCVSANRAVRHLLVHRCLVLPCGCARRGKRDHGGHVLHCRNIHLADVRDPV